MHKTSADFSGLFRLKGKSRNTFDTIMSTKSFFFIISVLRGFGGLQPSSPFCLGYRKTEQPDT